MNKPYTSEKGGEINIDSMYSRLNHKTKNPVLLDVETLALVYQDQGDIKQGTDFNLDEDSSDEDSVDSDDEFIDSDESSF
jgi:hypothetical protein